MSADPFRGPELLLLIDMLLVTVFGIFIAHAYNVPVPIRVLGVLVMAGGAFFALSIYRSLRS